MRLEYQPTLNDYIAAMNADLKARGHYFSNSYISWIISICFIILALNYLYMFLIDGFLLWLLLGVVMSPPVLKILFHWLLSFNFKRDKLLHGHSIIDINETQIIFQSGNTTTELQWQEFEHFIESTESFKF
jgi:peptidoglycan biosynthesis protein MviN/MurJ (putative lipid II flippase)